MKKTVIVVSILVCLTLPTGADVIKSNFKMTGFKGAINLAPPLMLAKPDTREYLESLYTIWKEVPTFDKQGNKKTIRVLDAGCGMGAASHGILKFFRDTLCYDTVEVDAIDINELFPDNETVLKQLYSKEEGLEVAESIGKGELNFSVSDLLTHWERFKKRYDYVVLNAPLYEDQLSGGAYMERHASGKLLLLDACIKAVKKNGFILVTFHISEDYLHGQAFIDWAEKRGCSVYKMDKIQQLEGRYFPLDSTTYIIKRTEYSTSALAFRNALEFCIERYIDELQNVRKVLRSV